MGKVIKYNFRLLLRSKMFMLSFVIMIGISISVLISFLKEAVTTISKNSLPSSLQHDLLKIQFQGTTFLLILSFIIYVLYTTLQETLQKEKASRRTEFLLANGIQLRDIWIGTALANFIASFIITIIIEGETLVIAKVVKINPFSMFDAPYLSLWIVGFPLIVLSFSFLFVTIDLIMRRVELMQAILFLSFYLVSFGGSYFLEHLSKKFTLNSTISLFTWNIVGIFLLIAVMVLIVALLIARKIDVDDITLSIPG